MYKSKLDNSKKNSLACSKEIYFWFKSWSIH